MKIQYTENFEKQTTEKPSKFRSMAVVVYSKYKFDRHLLDTPSATVVWPQRRKSKISNERMQQHDRQGLKPIPQNNPNQAHARTPSPGIPRRQPAKHVGDTPPVRRQVRRQLATTAATAITIARGLDGVRPGEVLQELHVHVTLTQVAVRSGYLFFSVRVRGCGVVGEAGSGRAKGGEDSLPEE